ncbi:MAG TPA: oligosaccharide flippase family protein [Acetobacteraceae bacterium]|nr:oligosaccharide flippase family protein [Acetobacteraceae bacterium]
MSGTVGLKRQVLRGLAWASVTRATGQMLNWVMTLCVVHLLRPSDYGLMAITMAVTGFLTAMSHVGFSDALVQTRDPSADTSREAFGLILLVNAAFFAILFALAPLLAAFYHEPRLTSLLRVASVSLFLLAFGALSRATLQRELALKQMSMLDMVANVLGGAATIVLAWDGFGAWSLLAAYLASEAIRAIGFCVLAPHRHWPAWPSRRQAALLHAGMYRTLESLLWYVSTQIDVFITGRMLGSSALGVYSLARTLASLPIDKLAVVAKPIGLPAFARLQDDKAQALAYLAKSVRVLAFVSLPVFAGLSAVAPALVAAVLGPAWTGAAAPLAILALGMSVRPAGLFIAPFLIGMGYFRASMVNTLATTILFGVAYGAGAHWGLYGVCVGAAIAYPVQFLFMVHRIAVVRKGCFRLLLQPLLAPATACLLMYLAVLAASWTLPATLPARARLALLVGTGGVAYAGAALLLCRSLLLEIASMVGLDRRFGSDMRPARAAGS